MMNTRCKKDQNQEAAVQSDSNNMNSVGVLAAAGEAGIIEIGPYDVICGRTSAAFNNVGNKRFRILVAAHLARYIHAETRHAKGLVIQEVVALMTVKVGARFFKQTKSGVITLLDDKLLRQKVGHALRDAAAQRFGSRKKEDDSASANAASSPKQSPPPKRRSSASQIGPQRSLSVGSLKSNMSTQSAPETEPYAEMTVHGPSLASMIVDTRRSRRISICNHDLPVVDFWDDKTFGNVDLAGMNVKDADNTDQVPKEVAVVNSTRGAELQQTTDEEKPSYNAAIVHPQYWQPVVFQDNDKSPDKFVEL